MDRNKIIDDAACDEEAVVPYVGTWIEMMNDSFSSSITSNVVPYVGTWIEIMYESNFNNAADVVPYVGTWIEMF